MTPIPLDPHDPAKAKKLKQIALIGGVGLLAVLFLMSRNASSSSASTPASSTVADTSGIDPATGIPYADETGASASTYPYDFGSGYGSDLGGGGGYGSLPTTTDPGTSGGGSTAPPAPNVTVNVKVPPASGGATKHPARTTTRTKPTAHKPKPSKTVVKHHGGASHPNHAKAQPKHKKR